VEEAAEAEVLGDLPCVIALLSAPKQTRSPAMGAVTKSRSFLARSGAEMVIYQCRWILCLRRIVRTQTDLGSSGIRALKSCAEWLLGGWSLVMGC
jgi:hypothetical protein